MDLKLKIGDSLHGFRLIKENEIGEINSIARIFDHEKSGARLLQLENDDDNKVFSITFRTPPEDSNGLPHVLEHSVLCGSRKFPSKAQFKELAKGSLKTFLNAITMADRTAYPLASRNEADFLNLMNVYLDAVFFPNIHDSPEIMMQEGFHYELNERDDELIYKGVVYNEMKGAFSSPESVIMRKIQTTLFRDAPYGVESAGDPDFIPELTQEGFTSFHKRYYHPSNSYIFLHGNGKLEKQLRLINEEYLQRFNRRDVDSEIPDYEPPHKPQSFALEYPVSPAEDERDKTYLSLNFVVGKSTDPELCLAFDILRHLLLGTPAAPLRKAIIDAGLGKDVISSFNSSIKQPIFSVVAKNSNPDKKSEFEELILGTLQDLVDNGIDKDSIEASINIKEFGLREADYQGFPTGLVHSYRAMKSWIYDEDPFAQLSYEPVLTKIKTALTTRYFEELIEKYLLNNNYRSLLILKPVKGMAEKKAQEVREKLAEFKAGLSDKEIDRIIEQTRLLKERQQTPDPPEVLDKLPMLSLSDINRKAEELPLVEKEISGVRTLFHPMFTNRIGYLNLYFDSSSVPQGLLPYIPMLTSVLGKIGTERYGYGELSNGINIHTGGIDFMAQGFSETDNDKKYHPKLMVISKALMNKLPRLLELLTEIIVHTELDDRKRLREIIQQMKSRYEMAISAQGVMFALFRMRSYFSPAGMYSELISGLAYYKFIADLEKCFDKKADEIVHNLRKVAALIFNRSNLLASFTSAENDYRKLADNFNVLINELASERLEKVEYDFELVRKNEGLLTPGKVQYVAKGYNFRRLGFNYTGHLRVLSKIIESDYLWNRIRVQGGAYGAMINFSRNGNCMVGSYRDPNLKKTLTVFDQTADHIRSFDVSNREMTKYIIGTISGLDFPLTPSMKGQSAAANYISHLTQEDIQRERDEVLAIRPEDIKNLTDMIAEIMGQDNFCVLGSEGKIMENKDIFGKLVNIFE